MNNVYCVQDAETLTVLEYSTDNDGLLEKYAVQGLITKDIHIFEAALIIERHSNTILAYGKDTGIALNNLREADPSAYDYFMSSRNCYSRYYIGTLTHYVNTFWIFVDEKHQHYIAIADYKLTDEGRWSIEDNGFELFNDGIYEPNVKSYMKQMLPDAKPIQYDIVPLSLKEAQAFVNAHHRHHKQPQGHKFSVGLKINERLIGVIIAGRPVSRHLDDKLTLEVTRCCVLDGFKNAVSKLYSSVCKAAKAIGYRKVITYTLVEETGSSMKAVGFEKEAFSKGGSWSCSSRIRKDRRPITPKYRCSKSLS